MANVKITWVLPTERDDNTPLPAEQIDSVALELSIDNENFAPLGDYPPTGEAVLADLAPGTWYVRGFVKDIFDLVSDPLSGLFDVVPASKPKPLVSFAFVVE